MRLFLRCLVGVLVFAACAASRPTVAQDCSKPPQGFGSAWAAEYAKWCQGCGGQVTGSGPGIGCKPGPNWGGASGTGSGSGGSSNAAALASQAEQEAAARKDREEREKLQKEQEEAEARRRKFQEEQEELTQKIKGAAEVGLEPRGVPPTAPRPLDSSVVDLRHLDPDRPIVVDPNVVKGKPRVFPAQVPLKTLENPNYQKGFESLMAGTPLVALSYFNEARKELPDDLMVGHALGLTQDIIRLRRERAESDILRRAEEEAARGYAAWLRRDFGTALEAYTRASSLAPREARFEEAADLTLHWEQWRQSLAGPMTPEAKARAEKAFRVASGAVLPLQRGDLAGAKTLLKEALKLKPGDPNIRAALASVEGSEVAERERQKAMQPQR